MMRDLAANMRHAAEEATAERATREPDAPLEAMAADVAFNAPRARTALLALGFSDEDAGAMTFDSGVRRYGQVACCMSKHYSPRMACGCDRAKESR